MVQVGVVGVVIGYRREISPGRVIGAGPYVNVDGRVESIQRALFVNGVLYSAFTSGTILHLLVSLPINGILVDGANSHVRRVFVIVSSDDLGALYRRLARVLMANDQIANRTSPFRSGIYHVAVGRISVDQGLVNSRDLGRTRPRVRVPTTFQFWVQVPLLGRPISGRFSAFQRAVNVLMERLDLREKWSVVDDHHAMSRVNFVVPRFFPANVLYVFVRPLVNEAMRLVRLSRCVNVPAVVTSLPSRTYSVLDRLLECVIIFVVQPCFVVRNSPRDEGRVIRCR